MTKRLISLILLTVLLMTPALPAAAEDFEYEGDEEYNAIHYGTPIGDAYVHTSNGKGLNLRSGPGTNQKVIASIPYGARVQYYEHLEKTWVKVSYNHKKGFVMSRYLTYDKPAPKPKPSTKPAAKPAGSPRENTLKDVFKGFAFVSYTAQVRPSSPGGFVHMRWAPSKATDPIRDYHQSDVLHVISQNNDWAQVVDPDTGITGFMMRSFLRALEGDGVGAPAASDDS